MKTQILLMFCALILTATPAMAIPSAGDYEWAPGGPIIGTFTSNGSLLTDWNMQSTDTTAVWTPMDLIVTNSSATFTSSDLNLPGSTGEGLGIGWVGDPNSLLAVFVSTDTSARVDTHGLTPRGT